MDAAPHAGAGAAAGLAGAGADVVVGELAAPIAPAAGRRERQ